MIDPNPLLELDGLPSFSKIQPDHILPALTQMLADNRAAIAQLLASGSAYTWENFIQVLEDLDDRLNKLWSPISHLHHVVDTEAMRAPYEACLALLSAYRSELGHNQALYAGYRAIANSPLYAALDDTQRKIIDNELRDFHLAGVDLPPAQQARFSEIQQELSRLGAKFGQNLLDATRAWQKHFTDEQRLAGLPESAKALARQQAEQAGLEGWLLTLDLPSYLPAMNYLDDRDLRCELYQAFTTRASEQGTEASWDNGPVITEILALRHELAQLLGFSHYAAYSLATKMAESPQQVLNFLQDLARRARSFGERDLAELRDFAQTQHGISTLHLWDVPYYSEKLRLHRYDLSQQDLRVYFPLPRVLDGLFQVVKRLYGLRIEPQDGVDTWHPSVQFYAIYDAANALRGHFYLDPYARPGKRGGAWMGNCRTRKRRGAQLQNPVAYLVCNFSPPVGDTPALLTHAEVTTLFHEFGHGLHHLLTRIDHPSVSGVGGVAWDAVELPSQIMENWCWEREALDLFARHYQTDEALPAALYEKMRAARNFQAGLFALRQLEFALFDLRLHSEYVPGADSAWVQTLLDEVRQAVAVLIPPAFNRFQHSFSHIFSGGYAAGYYSYKWAEVLSADAFAAFEEEGIFNPDTGRRFLEAVLELGGSREPLTLFKAFRGREPQIDALLRHTGMQSS